MVTSAVSVMESEPTEHDTSNLPLYRERIVELKRIYSWRFREELPPIEVVTSGKAQEVKPQKVSFLKALKNIFYTLLFLCALSLLKLIF